MFDGPLNCQTSRRGPTRANPERRKTQDAMNGLTNTDTNEEVMSPGSDNDKDPSDTSSKGYGAE
ncbi:hypothetical protein E4U38_003752 [Claviceps purpurea]|nr:hypothetical protein E4U38_003752 [Claviceps purpurea]KAG6150174.1 hypothetical protein E4U28_002415 [Claviceps purpurea]KAG6219592.1 hypothetical protein E4U50_000036 [Claviceps purpurea]KAG6295976.1 hypothetical protein E4U46_003439 [Claviceps purpurea]